MTTPNAPPMAPPMEKAVAKVAQKAMTPNLLEAIRQSGSAKKAAKASLAKTVNAAVNVMIGNRYLTQEEGKDVKNALFSSAVKAIQKPKSSSKATPEDVFAAIRSAATQLKRHLKSPPPLTGAEASAKKALQPSQPDAKPWHPPMRRNGKINKTSR